MGITYIHFLDPGARNACMDFEMAELSKFWTEKVVEIEPTEREKPSLGLLLEKMPEVISVQCSDKKVELRLGCGDHELSTNLVHCLEIAETILVPTSPREPDRRSHGAGETVASEE